MANIYKSSEGERLIRERYLQILQRWPVPNDQLRIPTREGETFVVACGDRHAPPLLLFHGSAANSAMWMGDIAAWSQHFRVYAVDMIGEPGLSAPSRPPLTSEACALWLDDVMQGLNIERASIAGMSLGGWLALDYATRRPERVESLAVLCPAGVGRQKIGILLKAIALGAMGAWGRRKLKESILGRTAADAPPAVKYFMNYVALIHEHFRPRREKVPVFSDEMLQRLTMPLIAILGAKDALLDSEETRRRLERNAPRVEVRYLPDAGHFLPRQTEQVLDFLCRTHVATGVAHA